MTIRQESRPNAPFGIALLLFAGRFLPTLQQPFTTVAGDVNKKMVKLFGAGGFKGLPSYGTGILVSPKGYILTVNNHILTTVDLRVHLYDGRFYHAKVVAREPGLDVALVKIQEKNGRFSAALRFRQGCRGQAGRAGELDPGLQQPVPDRHAR